MISPRWRNTYSVSGRYSVNDKQIKKEKSKGELIEDNHEDTCFSVYFSSCLPGSSLSKFFPNSFSSKTAGSAKTACCKGLPDPNAMALKAGQSSSQAPECHPQDSSQLPLSQAAATACSHTENWSLGESGIGRQFPVGSQPLAAPDQQETSTGLSCF